MGICKASIFCILAILKENSDENHILEMKDIIGKMRALYGISIDRRTVTSDLPKQMPISGSLAIGGKNK